MVAGGAEKLEVGGVQASWAQRPQGVAMMGAEMAAGSASLADAALGYEGGHSPPGPGAIAALCVLTAMALAGLRELWASRGPAYGLKH